MLISDVKTAFKIADVEYNNSTKLRFVYLKKLVDQEGETLPNDILTKNYPRVYIIVVDNYIMKIGASQSKNGMKQTLNIYKDGGVKGRPGIRSYGVWYLLHKAVSKGKKVEFYMIFHNVFSQNVKGLLGEKEMEVGISSNLIEKCCLEDYKKIEKEYPQWNIQERGEDWSDEIKRGYSKITEESLKRKGRANN